MKTFRFATIEDILTEFGELVKKNRIERNQTQKEFAYANGISTNQLSNIERTGNTSMITLIKILKKLDKIDLFMSMLEVHSEFNPYDIAKQTKKLRIKHSKNDS